MKQYFYITGKPLSFDLATPLTELKLSDFYTPDLQNREITFVVLGMAVTGFFAYKEVKVSEKQALEFLKKQAVWQIYLPAPKKIIRPRFDVSA